MEQASASRLRQSRYFEHHPTEDIQVRSWCAGFTRSGRQPPAIPPSEHQRPLAQISGSKDFRNPTAMVSAHFTLQTIWTLIPGTKKPAPEKCAGEVRHQR
jgi:hypothetical protein